MLSISKLITIALTVVAITFAGCAGSPVALESRTQKNMLNLKPDMSIEQAIALMGPPSRTEMYKGKKGEVVQTYLYLINAMGYVKNPNNDSNFLPLVFLDNKLIGWGWSQLDTAANRYEFVVKQR